jgi:hypothetical protein
MRSLIALWCAVACAQEIPIPPIWTALMDFADQQLLGRAVAAQPQL